MVNMVRADLLKISIVHNVSYAEVERMADLIEYEGKITFPEITELSPEMRNLIVAVHEGVAADQVRRGIIQEGQDTKVLPRRRH